MRWWVLDEFKLKKKSWCDILFFFLNIHLFFCGITWPFHSWKEQTERQLYSVLRGAKHCNIVSCLVIKCHFFYILKLVMSVKQYWVLQPAPRQLSRDPYKNPVKISHVILTVSQVIYIYLAGYYLPFSLEATGSCAERIQSLHRNSPFVWTVVGSEINSRIPRVKVRNWTR